MEAYKELNGAVPEGLLDEMGYVVPVCCSECVNGHDLGVDGTVWCRKMAEPWQRDGFCSLGERRA